jgi:hypothetical protein
VAGIVFALVAIMHLLRLFYKTNIIISGRMIPLWISGVGFIISAILSVWMFLVLY